VKRVDYETIAHVYDDRTRDHEADPRLAAWLEARATESRGSGGGPPRVLDIGCGTGKQLAANAARWPELALVGVDLSRAMLAVARPRCPSAALIRADAARLPLRDASIDYAYSQFTYAHFDDVPGFAREARRVLAPGGRLVVTNIDPWEMADWPLYTYFPAAWRIDTRDFLPAGELLALLESAGFARASLSRRRVVAQPDLASFHAWVSRRTNASQLMAIAEGEYEKGLARVRARLAGPAAGRADPVHLCLVTFEAERPV
jgi:ubiquinone/menaquinone biosynthesis C-methylase UbiE